MATNLQTHGEIHDHFRALANGFQKLDRIKDSNRQSKQLEELTGKMRECKSFRLIKEFDREIKDEEGRNPPEVNKQLNDEKQSMWHRPASNDKSGNFSTIFSGTPAIASEKLHGASNYRSWAASVRLWFKGQGYLEHLTTRETDIIETDRPDWVKIDAQLCFLLWHSLSSELLSTYQAYETCYDVWNKAALVYSNDIRHYYDVLSNLVNLKHQNLDTVAYVNKIEALKHEFRSLMPATTSTSDQEAQWDKFFVVMTLINLRSDLDTVRDQILGGSTIPTFDDVLGRLVQISASQSSTINNIAPPKADSSALVSQTSDKGSGRNNGRKRLQCTHCNKLGHTRDRCWVLHGRPARPINVPQTDTLDDHSSQSVFLAGNDYKEYLRFKQTKQSSVVASVAQTGSEYRTDDWHRA